MSLDLHSFGKTSFYSNLIKMADFYGLKNLNIDVLDDTMIVQYVDVMKQKYISCWQNTIEHSTKLEFYKILFKNHYTAPHYLDYTMKANERKALIKLREWVITNL